MSMANIHIVCSGDCYWLLVCSGVLVCSGISTNRPATMLFFVDFKCIDISFPPTYLNCRNSVQPGLC